MSCWLLVTFFLLGVSANMSAEDKIQKIQHPAASQPRDSKGQFAKKQPPSSTAPSDVSEEARRLTSTIMGRVETRSRQAGSRASSRASSLVSIPERSEKPADPKIPASSQSSNAERFDLSVDDSPQGAAADHDHPKLLPSES